MSTIEIPLFPLNTVLFPGGVLPLRVFEPRYVDMIGRCMREGSKFGVVLIRSGVEAGGPVDTFDIGTLAQVVDFDQMPDGLLGITTRGTERFRILQRRREADGLNTATIESLPSAQVLPLPREFSMFAEMLKDALPQMGDYFKHLEPGYEDADWVSGRVVEVLPLPLPVKQQLLEIVDPTERWQALVPLIEQGPQTS
ncbi:MAG TPA: LON peptidase substrate-binding domain-containing protein [Steroidobacteraceae bacterium]|nr:LON peptidase substrate-binding domain-containing protein [Steroidobacteraceae bacterium]